MRKYQYHLSTVSPDFANGCPTLSNSRRISASFASRYSLRQILGLSPHPESRWPRNQRALSSPYGLDFSDCVGNFSSRQRGRNPPMAVRNSARFPQRSCSDGYVRSFFNFTPLSQLLL